MRTKKVVCFFIALLLFSTVTCSVAALPDTTVTFRGGGITINLTYPEEAHPNDNIWHNATLTANIALTLRNLTLVIRSPVDSVWQDVTSWSLFNRVLQENATLTEEMNFQLPSNANGTLQCFIYINSSQSSDYLSSTFYTTHVSELTFSEMQSLYNEMLANYTMLQANYTTLLNDYDDLLANYNSSLANYTALLSQYNQLSSQYNAQLATYQALLANYDKLLDDYDSLNANYMSKVNEYSALQADYNELNSTRNSLLANYTSLRLANDELNQTYTDLLTDFAELQRRVNDSVGEVNTNRIVMFIFVITLVALVAFIIYLKRGKEEPYVVIRKETVSVNQDETRDDSNQT